MPTPSSYLAHADDLVALASQPGLEVARALELWERLGEERRAGPVALRIEVATGRLLLAGRSDEAGQAVRRAAGRRVGARLRRDVEELLRGRGHGVDAARWARVIPAVLGGEWADADLLGALATHVPDALRAPILADDRIGGRDLSALLAVGDPDLVRRVLAHPRLDGAVRRRAVEALVEAVPTVEPGLVAALQPFNPDFTDSDIRVSAASVAMLDGGPPVHGAVVAQGAGSNPALADDEGDLLLGLGSSIVVEAMLPWIVRRRGVAAAEREVAVLGCVREATLRLSLVIAILEDGPAEQAEVAVRLLAEADHRNRALVDRALNLVPWERLGAAEGARLLAVADRAMRLEVGRRLARMGDRRGRAGGAGAR